MSTIIKHIKVKSNSAKKRVQELHKKKKLVEELVETKNYKTLKERGIEFVSPFSV